MRKFKLNGFEFRVYRSVSDMRRSIKRAGRNHKGTMAMVAPSAKYYYIKDKPNKGRWVHTKNDLGVVYLTEDIGIAELSHEMLHCATTWLRSRKQRLNLGNEIGTTEELLSYALTFFIGGVMEYLTPKDSGNFRNIKDFDVYKRYLTG